MKKLIALLMAMTLVLSLAACGGGEQAANLDDNKEATAIATDATTNTTDEVEETTESTEETTAPVVTEPAETEPMETEPAETTAPATEPVETTPTHTHSYTSKVTKAATCTEKGVKTFTCSCGKSYTESIKATGHSYSATTTKEATCTEKGSKTLTCKCGSSYTEEIKATGHSHAVTDSKKVSCTEDGYTKYACACGDTYTTTETAKGHSMSGWTTYSNPSNYAPGEKRNSCANCDYYESEMQYDRMFAYYAEVAHQLGTFSNAQELQGDLGKVITAAVFCQAVSVENVETDGRYLRIISVSDMNAFTTKCLGTTFDYTGIDEIWVLYESRCHYDASTDSLVIIPSGMGGGDPEPTRSVTFTTDDNINFTVSVAITWYYGRVSYGTMTVALAGGNYIITSYSYIY